MRRPEHISEVYTRVLASRLHELEYNPGRGHLFRHYISHVVSLRAERCREAREYPRLKGWLVP